MPSANTEAKDYKIEFKKKPKPPVKKIKKKFIIIYILMAQFKELLDIISL